MQGAAVVKLEYPFPGTESRWDLALTLPGRLLRAGPGTRTHATCLPAIRMEKTMIGLSAGLLNRLRGRRQYHFHAGDVMTDQESGTSPIAAYFWALRRAPSWYLAWLAGLSIAIGVITVNPD